MPGHPFWQGVWVDPPIWTWYGNPRRCDHLRSRPTSAVFSRLDFRGKILKWPILRLPDQLSLHPFIHPFILKIQPRSFSVLVFPTIHWHYRYTISIYIICGKANAINHPTPLGLPHDFWCAPSQILAKDLLQVLTPVHWACCHHRHAGTQGASQGSHAHLKKIVPSGLSSKNASFTCKIWYPTGKMWISFILACVWKWFMGIIRMIKTHHVYGIKWGYNPSLLYTVWSWSETGGVTPSWPAGFSELGIQGCQLIQLQQGQCRTVKRRHLLLDPGLWGLQFWWFPRNQLFGHVHFHVNIPTFHLSVFNVRRLVNLRWIFKDLERFHRPRCSVADGSQTLRFQALNLRLCMAGNEDLNKLSKDELKGANVKTNGINTIYIYLYIELLYVYIYILYITRMDMNDICLYGYPNV